MDSQTTTNNQYDIDKSRFIELFSKFTGISKRKVSLFLDDNPINVIFEHPASLEATIQQQKKISQLMELRSLYNNLIPYEKNYVFDSSTKAGNYFKQYFSGMKDKESFVCAFLDNGNRVISVNMLSSGTLNEAAVYPRNIVKAALQYDAKSVILAHNHPGGSLKPSSADIEVTKALANALSTVKIDVIDHIIVADNKHISFAEHSYPLSPSPNLLKEMDCIIKNNIIKQYSNEFPAIKHISDDTAKFIDDLNVSNGTIFTIKDIKKAHKQAGKNFEASCSFGDKESFDMLQSIVDDLKRAQLTEKKIQAQNKATTKHLEMDDISQ